MSFANPFKCRAVTMSIVDRDVARGGGGSVR